MVESLHPKETGENEISTVIVQLAELFSFLLLQLGRLIFLGRLD